MLIRMPLPNDQPTPRITHGHDRDWTPMSTFCTMSLGFYEGGWRHCHDHDVHKLHNMGLPSAARTE